MNNDTLFINIGRLYKYSTVSNESFEDGFNKMSKFQPLTINI